MSTYRQFMKQNVKADEHEFHPISKRFVDENDEPILFEFRVLSSRDVDSARDSATTVTRKGTQPSLNTTKLMHALITASMVYPDLEDKELQDSYGVIGSSALISEMFNAPEYNKLNEIVGALAGFDKDDEDLINEAKN